LLGHFVQADSLMLEIFNIINSYSQR
jgi:hypothetical protein